MNETVQVARINLIEKYPAVASPLFIYKPKSCSKNEEITDNLSPKYLQLYLNIEQFQTYKIFSLNFASRMI